MFAFLARFDGFSVCFWSGFIGPAGVSGGVLDRAQRSDAGFVGTWVHTGHFRVILLSGVAWGGGASL